MFLQKIKILSDYEYPIIRKAHSKNFKTRKETHTETRRVYNTNSSRPFAATYEKKKVTYKYFTLFEKGFEIEFKNNLTVIVGDNGCGKTSLIKLIKPKKNNTFSFSEHKKSEEDIAREYVNDGNRELIYVNQPNLLIIENNIHKHALIEQFKDNVGVGIEKIIKPSELLSMWDMQCFSNGENTIDFITSLNDIENSLIVLDEPETSLSLKSVNMIKRVIRKLSFKNQVIIITHHPYLMELSKELYDFETKKYVKTSNYLNFDKNGK
jgi:predicted ATPase